jgi:hypothetical protein
MKLPAADVNHAAESRVSLRGSGLLGDGNAEKHNGNDDYRERGSHAKSLSLGDGTRSRGRKSADIREVG